MPVTAWKVAFLVLFVLHSQFLGYFIRDMLVQDNFGAIQPLAINLASIAGYAAFAFVFRFLSFRASFAVLLLSFVAGYALYLVPANGLMPLSGVTSLFAAGGNDIVLLVLPLLLWPDNRDSLLAVLGLVLVRIDYAVTLAVETLIPAGWTLTLTGRVGASLAVIACFALVLIAMRADHPAAEHAPASGEALRAQRPVMPETLTNREKEVAALLLQGCGRKDIAARLVISESTLNKHCHAIYKKTGCRGHMEFYSRYAGIAEAEERPA